MIDWLVGVLRKAHNHLLLWRHRDEHCDVEFADEEEGHFGIWEYDKIRASRRLEERKRRLQLIEAELQVQRRIK